MPFPNLTGVNTKTSSQLQSHSPTNLQQPQLQPQANSNSNFHLQSQSQTQSALQSNSEQPQPSIQQGSLPIRRKSSVGNVLVNLVNSMRSSNPPAGTRRSNRNSCSNENSRSNSRSRSNSQSVNTNSYTNANSSSSLPTESLLNNNSHLGISQNNSGTSLNNPHNRFNAQSYNYSMNNSPTIQNFRTFIPTNSNSNSNNNINSFNAFSTSLDTSTPPPDADFDQVVLEEEGEDDEEEDDEEDDELDIVRGDNHRGRSDTLRDTIVNQNEEMEYFEPVQETEYFVPVPMNSDNNPTLGTTVNNPITVEDYEGDVNMSSSEHVILLDALEEQLRDNSNNRVSSFDTDGSNNEVNNVNGSTTVTSENVNENENKCDENGFYSIRLTPFIDHSSTHPYMFFGPIIRKIRPGMVIPVGRYTDKSKSAATAPPGSSAGVIFKSKVVSRQHAELIVDKEGKWFIRDIKSSSGTFLNHIRLSAPGSQSGDIMIRDSDVLQLGVDYRGGSEEIYRCVKVKIELNFSWKRKGAKFSKEAHQRLKHLTLEKEEEDLTPCVICLGSIQPCQAVFVSSCSHSWHYKCIRPLIVKTYPQFLCPNCKAVCDMEAELDDDE